MNKQLIQVVVLGILVGICSSAVAADPADTHPNLHLIPWPKRLEEHPGVMPLTKESRIVAGEKQLEPLSAVLSEELALITGLTLPVVTGPSRAGDIVLKINKSLEAGEPILVLRNREPVRTTEGAHTITIGEQAVVEGFDYRAAAEGSSTILQLLGKANGKFHLSKVTIQDWPHADYCGVMLDVARQDHPIDAIKRVVQLCRLYKARYLQLHLTDDQGWTFPSTKYPQLGTQNYGAHGGVAPRVYKLDELQALVAYTDARGVTLVPEFEMPGHSGAASRALPEIFDAINPQSKEPVGLGCMNMSSEEIYPALDTLIGEMCDVFKSSPYFHIGSDEVTSGRLSLNSGYKAFMEKRGLKDDSQLADYFVAQVCEIVKKHGKKAIKWEGLSNTATKDVIIMAWEGNSTCASEMIARGYTTITCPWNLGVPWEEWNLYRCNASQLKKGDPVLGATLVAWEQPAQFHVSSLRNLPSRQERTWGPDNSVTVAGFAARFQPLDAIAGKLLETPPLTVRKASFAVPVGVYDFLDPVFAFDGNDATFYKSAVPLKAGDHFTVTFPEPVLVHAIDVLTGINNGGLLDGGEVQSSADGSSFATVTTLTKGSASAVLKENRVKAIRLRATSQQDEPLVVRGINLHLMMEVSGKVSNPSTVIGEGNVAVIKEDTAFTYPIGACLVPVINRGFTLTLNNGGNAYSYGGPISGTGNVELYAGGEQAPLVLDGKASNTLRGTWLVKSGRVVLGKEPGADALGGTIIVEGQDGQEVLLWNGSNQIQDEANVQLLSSEKGVGSLNLNGFSDTIGTLSLAARTQVLTSGSQGGGVLTVRELRVDGKELPPGVYTSSTGWVQGSGFVIVGDVKEVSITGLVDDPNQVIGKGNIAQLQGATTLKLPAGESDFTIQTGDFPLTLVAGGDKVAFSGFLTGRGSTRLEASAASAPGHQPLVLSGSASNSYRGTTTLARGVLKLRKPENAIAIPGNLTLGGSAADNQGDGVIWEADGQISPSASVTLEGTQPSFLDLNGHKVSLSKLVMSASGSVRTGNHGELQLKQLHIDGKRLADGVYQAPQSWLTGTGLVTVDARVAARGTYGAPDLEIGQGNVANLTGDMKVAYPASGCGLDIATNGFTLTFDSGNGNPLSCSGSISGTGNVEFFMGPSYTGFQDAPLRIWGEKPNTSSGKFFVRKGRVQLEKPAGVDAISGDVIIGGQGFNDCLFWSQSNQIKDSANITLLDAGNSGAAYLHLNGCSESAASLTMTANNKIKTDDSTGISGVLTVKSLSIGDVKKAAGTYTAATDSCIEGKGKVIVLP